MSKNIELVNQVIAIFDSFASYDLHGHSNNAIIYCTDELRKKLEDFKRKVSADE